MNLRWLCARARGPMTRFPATPPPLARITRMCSALDLSAILPLEAGELFSGCRISADREHTMSGPSASKLLVVSFATTLVFAPEAATAAPKYKNCYMDTRFRPPMRVCDDPTPYKKPKPSKEQVLVPIPSTGPSPFGPATRSRTDPSYRWRPRPSSPPDYRRSRAWPDRGQAAY